MYYMSLNKKFLFMFFIFFILVIGMFLGFFSLYYKQNLQAEEQTFSKTNEQLMEMTYNNVYLKKQIKHLIDTKKLVPDEGIKAIMADENDAQNRKIVDYLNDLYNKKYDKLSYLFQFMEIGLFWIATSIIFLWISLQYMVLKSVTKLIVVSDEVSKGNFGQRVQLGRQIIKDEFFILASTFNNMLDNIESNIMTISNGRYFLQSIIDAIPDGIRVMDKNGKIILANKSYQKLFGVTDCIGEYCYKHSMNIDHFCNENKTLCPLRELKKLKIKNLSTIQYFAKNPNTPISVSAAQMVINERGENQEYLIEAIRDLSNDIKFSHQQKLSSLAFLATSVAHEMKNNLGSLRMIFEQLMSDKAFANTQAEKYLELAYNQVLECIKIPENLLNLSKNSSETTKAVNISEVVSSVYKLLDYDSKRKGITLNMDISEDLYLYGNDSDFKMIFLNLCQNAIKAMDNGGFLNIKSKISGRKAEISVSDTGKGISKDKIIRIFEPFFSVSGSENNKTGTGLGLSIVKSLVENFNGSIKVQSKLNKGTTFTMVFPIKNK